MAKVQKMIEFLFHEIDLMFYKAALFSLEYQIIPPCLREVNPSTRGIYQIFIIWKPLGSMKIQITNGTFRILKCNCRNLLNSDMHEMNFLGMNFIHISMFGKMWWTNCVVVKFEWILYHQLHEKYYQHIKAHSFTRGCWFVGSQFKHDNEDVYFSLV